MKHKFRSDDALTPDARPMRSSLSFVVRNPIPDEAATRLNDLVLAWALDIDTRKPRYILELDENHRGQKCGCECASCGAPLIAVNAAKELVRRRPHFRHPEGAASDQCALLSARMAILGQYWALGTLDLPRRRMSATAQGLSGESHGAWVESPSEQVRITDINFHDRAFALLTLDDGRQLRVQLVGTVNSAAEPDPGADPAVACVYLEVDDPAVASMSPAELRQRLTLLPENLRWCRHWDDSALLRQAERDAWASARTWLDSAQEALDLPPNMDPSLKRETVLHYEVKRILAEAVELHVPALAVRVEHRTAQGKALEDSWSRDAERLQLTDVRLECRYGQVMPEVSAMAQTIEDPTAYPMHIEVTVTNDIGEERLQRIRSANVPTLEIDLSRCGGRIDREGLKELVLSDLSAKRWLHHPLEEEHRRALQAKLAQDAQWLHAAETAAREQKRAALAKPLPEVAQAYRAALTAWLELAADVDTPAHRPQEEAEALRHVHQVVSMMASRGFPEAGHPQFIEPARILSRLLSIEADRGIGYRYPSAWGVLNAIRQSTPEYRSHHTLFLIAAHVYQPSLTTEQRAWMKDLRDMVTASVKKKEPTYLRAPTYDRVVALLFPEMAEALENPFGKRVDRPPSAPSHHEPTRYWNGFELLPPGQLAAWVKAHPEQARAVFGADYEELARKNGW